MTWPASAATALDSVPTRPLFVIGMMGSGKTQLAKALARGQGCTWVDADARLERMFGCTCAEMINRNGEEMFRARERDALRSLCAEIEGYPVVVATGGGVVLHEENLRVMHATGSVLCLYVPLQELAKRLSGESSERRPLLGDGPLGVRLQALWDARKHAYGQATFIVLVRPDDAPTDVAGEVMRRWREAGV